MLQSWTTSEQHGDLALPVYPVRQPCRHGRLCAWGTADDVEPSMWRQPGHLGQETSSRQYDFVPTAAAGDRAGAGER
ncbi:MAG: hypothetical protein R2911_37395 [Caldilineaceae bacterium]